MRRVFLLGPGQFLPPAEGSALDARRTMAAVISQTHDVIIMEDEPHAEGETDADKFLRLLRGADKILVWLPKHGRLPTVFAELVAIRVLRDPRPKPIAVLYEEGVLDATGPEFLSLVPEGRIAYLRDLPNVVPVTSWMYTNDATLQLLVHQYARDLLDLDEPTAD